jgi:hypothetical protein
MVKIRKKRKIINVGARTQAHNTTCSRIYRWQTLVLPWFSLLNVKYIKFVLCLPLVQGGKVNQIEDLYIDLRFG